VNSPSIAEAVAEEAGVSWVSFLLRPFLWTSKEKDGPRQAYKVKKFKLCWKRNLYFSESFYFASWRVTFLCLAKEK